MFFKRERNKDSGRWLSRRAQLNGSIAGVTLLVLLILFKLDKTWGQEQQLHLVEQYATKNFNYQNLDPDGVYRMSRLGTLAHFYHEQRDDRVTYQVLPYVIGAIMVAMVLLRYCCKTSALPKEALGPLGYDSDSESDTTNSDGASYALEEGSFNSDIRGPYPHKVA